MTTDDPSISVVRFPSLAAMRAAHRELLNLGSDPIAADSRHARVVEFLETGRRTGAVLQQRADRSAAQGLLDYWIGVLVAAPTASIDDVMTDDDVLLDPFNPESAPDLSDKQCPYIGLATFTEADAGRFYGREEAVQSLVEKVERQSVVIVVGPSGSGKSSLVLAGLLPKLTSNHAGDANRWKVLPVIVPGNHPIESLLRTLQPDGPPAKQRPQSAEDRHNAITVAPQQRRTLLVVDQFEELFTLCEDQNEREAYASAIVALAGGPEENRVVITIREDYLKEAVQLRALKPFAENPEARLVPPAMTARELRRVIEQPAALVGLTFDEGLVDDLVKEVVGEPTALPLLQFTLLRLWESKARNCISWDAYRSVGSPREALKRTADATYEQLPQDLDRRVTRLVFLELVKPAVGVEFVRLRVRRESLHQIASTVTVDGVLDRFTGVGLIRLTPGQNRDDDRFEVTHEALIRNWPLLAGWLEKKRMQSEKEIQLAATARLWKESGRKEGYLLTGDALNDAVRFADASADIGELVSASQAADAYRKIRDRRILVGAVTVLSVGCLAFGVMAMAGIWLYNAERTAKVEASEAAALAFDLAEEATLRTEYANLQKTLAESRKQSLEDSLKLVEQEQKRTANLARELESLVEDIFQDSMLIKPQNAQKWDEIKSKLGNDQNLKALQKTAREGL